jgi:hypothetical protein
VRAEDLRALRAEGAVELAASGYRVASSVARRLKHGKDGTVRYQHYDLEDREMYVQGGVKRKASVNRRLSALDRLAHRTDMHGEPILAAALIEAGKRIAKDYNATGHGLTATQRYDSSGVQTDSAARGNAVEDGYIRTADGRWPRRRRDCRVLSGSILG